MKEDNNHFITGSNMKNNVEPSNFKCDICEKSLSSKQRLETHKDSNHRHLRSLEFGYKCMICGKHVKTKRNLDRHRRILHERSPLKGIYKQYTLNPEVPVPERTLRRLTAAASNNIEDAYFENNRKDTNSVINNVVSVPTKTASQEHSNDEDDDCLSDSSPFKLSEKNTEYENISVNTHNLSSDTNNSYSSDSSSVKLNEYSAESDDEMDHALIDASSESSEAASDFSVSEDVEYSSSGSSGTGKEWSDCDSSEIKAIELCFQAYVKRYNLSNEATKHLREFVSIFSPDTKIKQQTHQKDIDCVHYCIKCNELFPSNRDVFHCSGCNDLRYEGNLSDQQKTQRRPRGSFIIANMHDQLTNLLEKPGIWTSIQNMKQSISGGTADSNIHDIVDGQAYKNLCRVEQFLNNINNLSAIINTDGIPLYSSSKVKLWPVFVAINEIPPAHRFSRDNLILAGMWQGKGNPPFKQYICSLAVELNKLYTDGIYISTSGSDNKINVRLAVLCATLDLQAKGYVANMSMHNGQYGCSTCEESGLVVKKGKGHVRSYPYRSAIDKPQKRTALAVEADGLLASRNNRLKGICGVSGLSSLLGFNIVDGLVPDYMHGLLLGVTKTLMTLWFSKSNAGHDFYIGNRLNDVSFRISQMTPPDSIERLPRDLEHYAHFKATEFQVWLLFYCMPCIKGILPDKYLEHFGLLSESAFLLLGDNITAQNLQTADYLLDTFYKNCGELYGPDVCGLNVHNAGAHLVDFVKLWGPVWCWSCFPFEDMNAAILKSVHGTGDVSQQAIFAKQNDMQLNKLSAEASVRMKNKKVRHFMQKVSGCKKKCTAAGQVGSCKTIGRLTQLIMAECSEGLLQSTSSDSLNDLKKCLRVELNEQIFFSKGYQRMKKRICHFVICGSGEVAAIHFFVVNKQNEVFALVELYEVPANCYFFGSSGRHIFKIKSTESMKVINVMQIMDKLFFLSVGEEQYVARMPNILGRSVFK